MTSATAFIVREKGAPFQRVQVDLDYLQPEEVLVKVHATSICATDINVQKGKISLGYPALLGHEGSGTVLQVGKAVEHVIPGDHVVMSYDYCGTCKPCRQQAQYRCAEIGKRNFGGARPDGTSCVTYQKQRVSSSFFGQSSFCNPTIVQAKSCVKIDSKLPLEVMCALGCGFQTGAGSVFNLVKPIENKVSSLTVWGCGGVGCAAIMAADVLRKQNPEILQNIIAVDIDNGRLELAKELGATDIINSSKDSVARKIQSLTNGEGSDAAIDCTGIIPVINEMVQTVGSGGVAVSVGGPLPSLSASIEVFSMILTCKAYMGCHQGNSDSHKFIPFLADLYAKGYLPIERLQKQYSIQNINEAVHDMESGLVIKPVLIWN